VSDSPWDPGLQPERTTLAWRRTGLALTVGSLIGLRVLPPLLGPAAFVLAGLGVVASLAVLAAAHRRYRRVHRLLLAARDAGHTRADAGPGSRVGSDSGPGEGIVARSTGQPARVPTTGGALPAATAALALAASLGALVVALGVR
jgi:putative membrane protein